MADRLHGQIGMQRPRAVYFEKASDVPNSNLPVLIFRGALAPTAPAKARRFREAFRRNGWTGVWTDTIYDYTHFQPTRMRCSELRKET
jgi:uncharacterized protein YjlB